MSTQTRVVTVYSTKGKSKAKITTDVTTWGDLIPLVQKEGYDVKTLHATESINRADLVSTAAILPASDFTLFLRPKQTKSGADAATMGYKELRAVIKDAVDTEGDKARDHFNAGGKNYTNKSTDELRELVHDWLIKVAPTKKSAPISSTSTSPGAIVKEAPMTDEQKVALIEKLAKEVNAGGQYIVTLDITEGCDADCQEDKALDREAEELMKSFK